MAPDLGNLPLTRRRFFHRVSGGIYGAALAYLLGSRANSADEPGVPPVDLKPRPPHFAAKATSVIHLFMNGGPSQMDLFDPKPMLEKHHGEPYFDKIAGEVEFIKDAGALMRSPFKFAQYGQCGAWVSEVYAAPRGDGGRPRLHPLDVHHQPDARAGHLPHPLR